jgi:ParB/RepB/Spo0J family partition protein
MKAETTNTTTAPALRQIPLAHIAPSRTNPRKNFDPAKIAELADSIKSQGIAVPLLVRPLTLAIEPGKSSGKDVWFVLDRSRVKGGGAYDGEPLTFKTEKEAEAAVQEGRFELVDGERRYRASQSIRLDTVPCVVKAMTDTEAAEVQLLSFVREDISDLEAARGYQELMTQHNYTAESLRQKLGLARSTFYGRMTILKVCPAAQEALAAGKITQSHAQLLATVPDPKAQETLLNDVVKYDQSVRDLKTEIERDYVCDLDKAPFSPKAEYKTALIPMPCEKCEFRGANAKDRYPTLGLRPQACLNAKCYQSKIAARNEELAEEFRKKGFVVLPAEEVKKVFPNDCCRPQGGYMMLDDEVEVAGKSEHYGDWKPIEELLGKDARRLTKAIGFRGSKPVELCFRAEVEVLLESKGVKLFRRGVEAPANETPEQKAAREAKEKAEREKEQREAKIDEASASRCIAALATAIEKAKNPGAVLPWLLSSEFDTSENAEAVLQRRGLDTKLQFATADKLAKALTKMSTPQLLSLFVELRAWDYRDFMSEAAEELAAQFKVDVKRIRKQVAAELEATEKKAAETKPAPGKKVAREAAKAAKGKGKK